MFDACNLETMQPDLDALKHLVRTCLHDRSPIRVVEIGSWVGRTALAMASVSPFLYIHCIDTWLGSPGDSTSEWAKQIGQRELFQTFCRNCKGHGLMTHIIPHIGTSELWASVWPWPADLVFIDGEHSEEACLQDIKLWTPHVRKGGILCGHDFDPQFPGVEKAVRATGPFERLGSAIWWRRISSEPQA
jgi:methyltransferase family protein